MKYCYLKNTKGEAPFYVHITLDDKKSEIRVFYQYLWCKFEDVDETIFAQMKLFMTNISKNLSSKHKKHTEIKDHAVVIRGRCLLYSSIFKDLVGFVSKDTPKTILTRVDCQLDRKLKVIEVELKFDFDRVGSMREEIMKLPIFTNNPNYEWVRNQLCYFKPSYLVVSHQMVDNLPTTSPSSFQPPPIPPIPPSPPSSPPSPPPPPSSQPPPIPSSPPSENLKPDILPDLPFCVNLQHPYASLIKN